MNSFFRSTADLRLGVNIDHIATLRNVRGTPYPDPISAALIAEEAGADAITLHLREDRRHIRDSDVKKLRPILKTRMNLECAVTSEMLEIVCEIAPHDVCLVPERREELTTEGGLDVVTHFQAVKAACAMLHSANIRVSLFIDAQNEQIQAAAEAGATVIEIHTGHYADAPDITLQEKALQRVVQSVTYAKTKGLMVNAGHGLHYQNVQAIAAITAIDELNIGHAIVAHALFSGWSHAVREMKSLMTASRLSALNRGAI